MPTDPRDKPAQPADVTIPSRSTVKKSAHHDDALQKGVPWVLQQSQWGAVDLGQELAARYPQMPVMSLMNTRMQGRSFSVATLSTQDGAAGLRVELHTLSSAVSFVFVLNSMIALRFTPSGMTDSNRQDWLREMRQESGKEAFLWSPLRYRTDFILATPYKHYTNLFAFSPANVEAAARLTADVTRKLLDWLASFWTEGAPQEDTLPPQSW